MTRRSFFGLFAGLAAVFGGQPREWHALDLGLKPDYTAWGQVWIKQMMPGYVVSYDELHEHQNREIYDAMIRWRGGQL